MELKNIKNNKQYEQYLNWVDTQFDNKVKAKTPVGEKLQFALLLIKQYEDAKIVEEIPFQPAKTVSSPAASNGIRFYSPLVLNIAQSEGVSMAELEQIPGSGQDGRVSKKDILAFVANKGINTTAPAPAAAPSR